MSWLIRTCCRRSRACSDSLTRSRLSAHGLQLLSPRSAELLARRTPGQALSKHERLPWGGSAVPGLSARRAGCTPELGSNERGWKRMSAEFAFVGGLSRCGAISLRSRPKPLLLMPLPVRSRGGAFGRLCP